MASGFVLACLASFLSIGTDRFQIPGSIPWDAPIGIEKTRTIKPAMEMLFERRNQRRYRGIIAVTASWKS
jgi:hypothetical protein